MVTSVPLVVVVYDDAAVEKLLNRQQVGEVEKDFGMNEYLCSFKVASYQIKDTAEEVSYIICHYFRFILLIHLLHYFLISSVFPLFSFVL